MAVDELRKRQRVIDDLVSAIRYRGRFLLWGVLATCFLNAFGICTFIMPKPEPDPSWIYALNQAVAQKMTFGKDIIFTFGPYASVYTHSYHPDTVGLMIFGIVLLDVLYITCFAWLANDAYWGFVLVLTAIVAIPVISPDAFLFSVPLLLDLLVFKLLSRNHEEIFSKTSTRLFFVFAFACLGLLPLIKGTILMVAVGNWIACAVLLAMNRHPLLALNCIVSPLTAMVGFWIGSGQKLSALPGYFMSLRLIIAGYSEAMALSGPVWVMICFVVCCIALLVVICWEKQWSKGQRIFLFVIYAMLLFFGFKAGFVREDFDAPHVPTALGCLVLGSLFLFLLGGRTFAIDARRLLPVSLICIGVIGLHSWHDNVEVGIVSECPQCVKYSGIRKLAFLRQEVGNWKLLSLFVSSEPFHLQPWNVKPNSWRAQFDEANRKIAASDILDFPISGSADIYSYEQPTLLANGYQWNPRPVLQSYSAYTPELIRRNEQHLRSEAAPKNIVFRLETIDNRFPALDDGLSWPAMIDNYIVAEARNNWIHLVRRPTGTRIVSQYIELGTVHAQLDQEIPLPQVVGPVFAEVSLAPSALGKASSVIYKIPSLALRVTSYDGNGSVYRVNANMMETGFIISPLVTTNDEFQSLFSSNSTIPSERRPRSMALLAGRSKRLFWNESYRVTFKQYLY